MDTNKQLNHKSNINYFKALIQFSFKNEGKFIIDEVGSILLENNKKLKLNISSEQNLLDFLIPLVDNLSPSSLKKATTLTKGFESVFSIEEPVTQWYRVLISPLQVDKNPLFLVQILNISNEKEIALQLIRQKKNIENEMLLRTKEIIMTDEVMASQGGFLQNFLRGLRHDLISPVTQLQEIISYYQRAETPEKKEKAAELINLSLQKLTNTAKGFSDFVDLHFLPQKGIEELSFQEIFQSTQVILENEITQSNATIKTDFGEKHIHFNKNSLESIFYNLLSNAIKFRSENRNLVINIRTYRKDVNTVLEIEDNGIGIDLVKYGHQLFVPFKRLNMNRPGAGIGLSLVKNILSRQQGTIEIQSQPDQGSKVIVVFQNTN